MTAAQYIVSFLKKNGIRKVWGYQGGNIALLIDALTQEQGIDFISSCNEQGAAFAANGEALFTGTPAVAIASSGPGAINLLNGIANAYFDSLPVLFITGDISRFWQKGKINQRQRGFQDTDIVSMVRGITKFAHKIQSPDELVPILMNAWKTMQDGRKGPALLSVPHWIFKAAIEHGPEAEEIQPVPKDTDVQQTAEQIASQLAHANHPVVLIGHGCSSSAAKEMLFRLFADAPVPVVTTLPGLDCVGRNWCNMFGFVGSFGERWANYVVKEADLLLVFGARLDERVNLAPSDRQKIIHVDIDPDEFFSQEESEKYKPVSYPVEAILRGLQNLKLSSGSQKYFKSLQSIRNKYVCASAVSGSVSDKLRRISGAASDDAVFVIDVGFHQMAAAHALQISGQRRILFSAGLGSMGFALPSALGVKAVAATRQVIVITGDGGLMMNLQELQTLKREGWQILIVVVNNQALGLICAVQDSILDGRHYGSQDGYKPCRMEAVAQAFDLLYYDEDSLPETVFVDMQLQKRSALLELREEDVQSTIQAEFSAEELNEIKYLMGTI